MFNPLIEELRQQLLMVDGAYPVATQSELARIRCPYCGDSKNLRSAHFYIGVKEQQIPVFDCKKCGFNGMVTASVLRRINIIDIQLEEYLKTLQRDKQSVRTIDAIQHITYQFPPIKKADKPKLDYLTSRLGMTFTQELIEKYKIVLDFNEFLTLNKITQPQVSNDNRLLFSQYGVGFLSENKTSIQFRSIDVMKTNNERFLIAHLYPNKRMPYMYIPPCSVDIMNENPHIIVSESAFNIINIQNYFYADDSVNAIFGSSSRKYCVRAIKKLIQMSGYINGTIDIFADRDKDFDLEFYRTMMKDFIGNFEINIYLNTDPMMKDFGQMPPNNEPFRYKILNLL